MPFLKRYCSYEERNKDTHTHTHTHTFFCLINVTINLETKGPNAGEHGLIHRHIKETRWNAITSSKPFFPFSSFFLISLWYISSSFSILSSSGLIIPRGQQQLSATFKKERKKEKVPPNCVKSTSSQSSERHALKEVKSVKSALVPSPPR